jgi:hypothetical protein
MPEKLPMPWQRAGGTGEGSTPKHANRQSPVVAIEGVSAGISFMVADAGYISTISNTTLIQGPLAETEVACI